MKCHLCKHFKQSKDGQYCNTETTIRYEKIPLYYNPQFKRWNFRIIGICDKYKFSIKKYIKFKLWCWFGDKQS